MNTTFRLFTNCTQIYNQKLRIISNSNSYLIFRSFISKREIKLNGDFDHTKQLTEETPINLTELSPQPSFISERIKLWDQFKQRYDSELAAKTPQIISANIIDKNGETKGFRCESWRTTPSHIANQIGSKEWSDSLIICKVNDILWDLDRVLESDCSVKFLTFEDTEGRAVYWHSSALVLAQALERIYGGHLGYCLPIDNGFYYDIYLSNDSILNGGLNTVSKPHFNSIESAMKNCCNETQPFERLELTKQELLQIFSYNRFKIRILNEKIIGERTTVYRCGTLIDLCKGPHVRHTGNIKAFKVTSSSTAFWDGKTYAESLQRINGISFPDQKQLDEWIRSQEEAAKRHHSVLGREQSLYFFHQSSPGSCFFTPRGTDIYNTLIDFIRTEYRKRGFHEVITPNILNTSLWKQSGHWEHFADNMFVFDANEDEDTYALKPMNCPGHCLLFDSESRSWRDLPLRFAEFGVLHRKELSGALSGLTRVTRFIQDDAHIFCTIDQISDEISAALNFLDSVYSIFGFSFDLCLSTRPEKFLGEIEDWNNAEKALSSALEKSRLKWTLNEGDGAFYGPKIDITLKDALKKSHQCATIQLDFQLPLRFDLKYGSDDGSIKRPVIIHRAILGSIERFIAIIAENFAGKWPFWLSPRQAVVIPIAKTCVEYAEKVRKQLYDEGFQVDVEVDPSLSINRKVRNAQLSQYNFILVVGEKEVINNSVNVRTRDTKIHGECSVDALIEKFNKFKREKTLNAENEF